MTVAAVFFLVTVDAAQTEQVDMLLVVKSDHRPLFVWRHPDLLVRDRDHRVRDTDDIGRVHTRSGQRLAGGGQVTYNALGIVTPLTVTGKALTMVSAFQTGLTKVFRVLLAAVAFSAGGNPPGRTVMVTGFAALTHLSHISVKLMVKVNRLIEVGYFINDKRIGSLAHVMFGVGGRHHQGRTRF
jgi:hypothetical protein